MPPRRPLVAPVAALALAALCAPSPAAAAEVRLTAASGGAWQLAITARAGERNRIRVAPAARRIAARVTDAGPRPTAGPGCERRTSGAVTCAALGAGAKEVLSVRARLGDRADAIALAGRRPVALTALGGPGADRLAGGRGADAFDGGPGDDAIDGGAGRDRLSYASRARPVALELRPGARGGVPGELDAVTGIEWVVGGSASDALRCAAGGCRLDGGGGADRLAGGAGKDRLEGGAGADRALGGGEADAVAGGGGDDRLAGGPGDDAMAGGGGADVLTGDGGDDELAGGRADRARGGRGDDDVVAGDAAGGRGDDTLRYVRGMRSGPCGPGLDSVRTRTRRDRVPRDCEFVGAWEFDYIAAAAPTRHGAVVSLRIVRNPCYDAGCLLRGSLWVGGVRVATDRVRWERPWSETPGAQKVLRWRLPPAAADVRRGEYVGVNLFRRQPRKALDPRSFGGFEARLH